MLGDPWPVFVLFCTPRRGRAMVETRKLAAILAADVVGFSRMTGVDEDGTLARLRSLRNELIDPTTSSNNGRVFKRTGDGILVEFRGVVDAVRCAIEVQKAMIPRNTGIPADRRIEFRVGMHLGDVVEESDGDLTGDGVNIAARLEGICEPDGVCLSEDAHRQHNATERRIEGFPERVVEIAKAFSRLGVNERHVLLHEIDAPRWRAERRGGAFCSCTYREK
jgi:class 3 adenylate cyclase